MYQTCRGPFPCVSLLSNVIYSCLHDIEIVLDSINNLEMVKRVRRDVANVYTNIAVVHEGFEHPQIFIAVKTP